MRRPLMLLVVVVTAGACTPASREPDGVAGRPPAAVTSATRAGRTVSSKLSGSGSGSTAVETALRDLAFDGTWLRGQLDPGSLWGTRTDAVSSTWRVTVENRSRVTAYQDLTYQAEYHDAERNLVQTRTSRLAGAVGPGQRRELEFNDGFVDPAVTTASLSLTTARAVPP